MKKKYENLEYKSIQYILALWEENERFYIRELLLEELNRRLPQRVKRWDIESGVKIELRDYILGIK